MNLIDTIDIDLNNPNHIFSGVMSLINNVNYKRESLQDLHDFIDAKVVLFDRKKIILRDMQINTNHKFNVLKNKMKKDATTGRLINKLTVKIPNKYFNRYPIVNKLETPAKADIEWKDLSNSKTNIFFNLNSTKYNKLVKTLTDNKCLSVNKIEEMELTYDEEINSAYELYEYFNKLSLPDDLDFIMTYIESVIKQLTAYEKLPLEETSLLLAFRHIENLYCYHNNVITILLKFYYYKLSLVFNNNSSSITLSEISSLLNPHTVFYQGEIFYNEGFDINNIRTKSNELIMNERIESLNYIKESINSTVETKKPFLDEFDKLTIGYALSDFNKTITDVMNTLTDELDNIEFEIFGKPYNELNMYVYEDIINLRNALLEDDYIKYIINNNIDDGIISNGNIDDKVYFMLVKKLQNDNRNKLSDLLFKYYNALKNFNKDINVRKSNITIQDNNDRIFKKTNCILDILNKEIEF